MVTILRPRMPAGGGVEVGVVLFLTSQSAVQEYLFQKFWIAGAIVPNSTLRGKMGLELGQFFLTSSLSFQGFLK